MWGLRWKPDGSQLFTGSDGTARIWRVFDDLDYLRGRIRARNRLRLDAAFYRDLAGDTEAMAERRVAACERCASLFFERLGEAPKSDVEAHVEAWGEYRRCLDRAASSEAPG